MGYLGFFYIEPKAFELHSEDGIGGIRFAERSRETYWAVIMGNPSVMWLRSTVEELVWGTVLREFYRSFRSQSIVYIAQRHANSHGRFLELSTYGVGGGEASLSFQIAEKGRGWEGCAA